MAKHRVEYMPLAVHLQLLPLSATCADLATRLATFEANDANWWAGVVADIRSLPAEAEWMVGLLRLCELLKEENPRFVPALLMEWVLEKV